MTTHNMEWQSVDDLGNFHAEMDKSKQISNTSVVCQIDKQLPYPSASAVLGTQVSTAAHHTDMENVKKFSHEKSQFKAKM